MDNNISEQKSIAGLRANAAAFLINLSYFVGFGLFISIISLILEKENKFVRAYSKQTLAVTVLLFVSAFLNFIIVVGTVLFFIIFIILFVFQIIATVSSILEKEFKIPFVEKITNLLFVN